MRDKLIALQVQEDGDNQGSWEPNTQWSSSSGRVYSTALSVMSLEVYYRYLPMYR